MDVFRGLCEEHGEIVSFRPGECFATRGCASHRWGFITKGVFGYAVTDGDGNENMVGFAFPDTLLGDYLAVADGRPAICDIKALSDAEVMVCGASCFRRLLARDGNALHVSLSDDLFEDAYTRFIDFYTLSRAERYHKILTRCPSLLQHISLKQLASYLRITPTHLSRIRRGDRNAR